MESQKRYLRNGRSRTYAPLMAELEVARPLEEQALTEHLYNNYPKTALADRKHSVIHPSPVFSPEVRRLQAKGELVR